MLAFCAIAILAVESAPLGGVDTETLERGQQAILAKMGHVMVWKFPEGPMTLGCFIMAAGIAIGVCIMCIWQHFQWNEITRGAVNAVRNVLRRDSRAAAMLATDSHTSMVLTPMENTSMIVHDASFDAPPAYEDISA